MKPRYSARIKHFNFDEHDLIGGCTANVPCNEIGDPSGMPEYEELTQKCQRY